MTIASPTPGAGRVVQADGTGKIDDGWLSDAVADAAGDLADHIADAADAHAASAITNTPAGGVAATTVQAAIDELDTDKIATSVIDTDGTLAANSDAKLATQKAVKTYADQLIASADAMVFKGVVDCSTEPDYPAADRGHTYRVSVAGKIGGASGINVEAGDLLLCLTDSTASGDQATVGTAWTISQVNLDGAVIGPASVTGDHFAQFDGTTGKLIKGGLSLDTDEDLAADSDTKIPSQKAVKAYVDANVGVGGGGMTWAIVTGATNAATNNGYIADHVSTRVSITLPASPTAGDNFAVVGKGAAGWSILQNSGQQIQFGTSPSVIGVNGGLQSIDQYAAVHLVCITAGASAVWAATASIASVATLSFKGYAMGGYGSGAEASIDDLLFSTEASVAIAATLDTAKYDATGVSGPSKGYAMGGFVSAVTNVIENMNYADDTSAAIGAVLPVAKELAAGCQSATKGYHIGGSTGSNTAVITGLTFNSEVCADISATLDTAKYGGTGVSGSAKGYCMGGHTSVRVAVIEDINFSSEASAAIVATLDTASRRAAGVNSATKGYQMGGVPAGYSTAIENMDFVSETSAAIAATLDQGTGENCGVFSGTKGYSMGSASGTTSQIEDLNFTTETSVALAATLDSGRYALAGVSN